MRNFLSVLVCGVCLAAGLVWIFYHLHYQWNWSGVYAYREKFILGWTTTLIMSFCALLISVALGLILALALRSKIYVCRFFGKFYVELIRGTPLLVQILIFFYVIASAVGLENRYIAGILSLAFFSSAYIAEIFRAGRDSISESQMESALAIGLTKFQTFRFVIAPQAAQVVLPPLTGQFISLIKDSSLLSIIAISELTLNAQEVSSFTYSSLESYLPMAVGYLILTLPLSMLSRYLERLVRFEN